MNDRERFQQIARFELADDPYEFLHALWDETAERWQSEGLPKEANATQVVALGQDFTEFLPVINLIRSGGHYSSVPAYTAIVPWFTREVIRDEGETEVVRDEDGVLYRVSKISPTVMPQFLEYPVKDWSTWKSYKKLLDPDTPDRWPAGWDKIDLSRTTYLHDAAFQGRSWNDRDFPLGILSLSLMGLPRNMMGVENYSYALYEDRSLVEDMAEHMIFWNMGIMKRIFSAGIKVDFCWLWEDICYKSGPLFSPKIMREIMVPRWRKFSEFLRSNGVELLIVDCDGNVDEFLPLVLEGGLNGIYPLEAAADNDPLSVLLCPYLASGIRTLIVKVACAHRFLL